MSIIIANDEKSFRVLATRLLTNQIIECDDLKGLVLPNDNLLLALIEKMTQEHFNGIRNNAPVSTNEAFLALLRRLHSIVITQKECLPQSERRLQEDINTFWTPLH